VTRRLKLSTSLLAVLAIGPLAISPLANADVVANPRFEIDNLVIVWSANETGTAPVVADFIIDNRDGSADTDLIAEDAFTVVTGTLNSTNDNIGVGGFPLEFTGSPTGDFTTDTNNNGSLDAGDALAAFQLDTDFDVASSVPRTSFYVASNTPFSISAEVTDVQVDPVFTAFSNAFLGFVDLVMEVAPVGAERTDGTISYGSAAQTPHSDGETGGFLTPFDLLDLVNTPTTVFAGNQRTAATPGSIADQSVRFDISYSLIGATIAGYDLSLGVIDFGVTVEYTVFVP